jgi:hypothetical protein
METKTWKAVVGIFALSALFLVTGALRAQAVTGEVPDPPAGGDLLAGETDPPDGITDTTEPEPPDPSTVALDAEGNPYPQGGPSGLYGAITDKQVKTADGGGSPGNANALSRLRGNLNRWLQKKGLLGDDPPDAGGGDPEIPGDEGIAGDKGKAALAVPGASGKSFKLDGSANPQRPAKIDKPVKREKIDKPIRPAKIDKPVRPAKIDKPSRPQKIARPAKPEKPDKPHRWNR